MIIVSQDKTELINFSNIVRLGVSNNTKGQFLIEAHNFCDDFETVIGFYKTKERAKQVLQEIIRCYSATENYKLENENGRELIDTYNDVLVYKMPEG